MRNTVSQVIKEQRLERSLREWLALWLRRHATRHQLKLMLQQDPNRLYDDLGLSKSALQQECRKWFWEE